MRGGTRMIEKEKIKQCAENITKSINIQKEGELVLIKGGLYTHELLEEIGLSVLRKGGLPHITPTRPCRCDSLKVKSHNT